MTGAVLAAAIRRRIRIPLRFADGYSTTVTVVTFTGLADAQQHVALELGRPARPGHRWCACTVNASPVTLSRSLERAAEPHLPAGS